MRICRCCSLSRSLASLAGSVATHPYTHSTRAVARCGLCAAVLCFPSAFMRTGGEADQPATATAAAAAAAAAAAQHGSSNPCCHLWSRTVLVRFRANLGRTEPSTAAQLDDSNKLLTHHDAQVVFPIQALACCPETCPINRTLSDIGQLGTAGNSWLHPHENIFLMPTLCCLGWARGCPWMDRNSPIRLRFTGHRARRAAPLPFANCNGWDGGPLDHDRHGP